TKIKKRPDAHALQPGDFRLKLRSAANSVNPPKLCFKRFRPGGIDLLLVHAAGVKIAYLLLIGARSRLGICRRCLQNLVKRLTVSFGKFVEASPAWIRSGHGIFGNP